MCNLGPTWRKLSPVAWAGDHLGIQTVGYRLASGKSNGIGDAFVEAGDAPTRAFHGWIRKSYKDATTPYEPPPSTNYSYQPPPQYSTSPTAYGYDGGSQATVQNVPSNQKSLYDPATEAEKKKTTSTSTTKNTTVSNIS